MTGESSYTLSSVSSRRDARDAAARAAPRGRRGRRGRWGRRGPSDPRRRPRAAEAREGLKDERGWRRKSRAGRPRRGGPREELELQKAAAKARPEDLYREREAGLRPRLRGRSFKNRAQRGLLIREVAVAVDRCVAVDEGRNHE